MSNQQVETGNDRRKEEGRRAEALSIVCVCLTPSSLFPSLFLLSFPSAAAFKIINTLHRNKLIYHESKKYDGYRLTYLGYDYLALRTYVARGLISGLGRRIGVGKEADIYECTNEAGEIMVLKIHRSATTANASRKINAICTALINLDTPPTL